MKHFKPWDGHALITVKADVWATVGGGKNLFEKELVSSDQSPFKKNLYTETKA